jgi:hypothetical protein
MAARKESPLLLEGACRCGAVRFSVESRAPVPYQRCYCTICRKTAGGGGYAINLHADTQTLKVRGKAAIGVFRARLPDPEDACRLHLSSGRRHFCTKCASALWLADPEWPELLHPFASVIDSELPKPPSSVHLMLRFKASWVVPQFGRGDAKFQLYPKQSIEDWHRARGLWLGA